MFTIALPDSPRPIISKKARISDSISLWFNKYNKIIFFSFLAAVAAAVLPGEYSECPYFC